MYWSFLSNENFIYIKEISPVSVIGVANIFHILWFVFDFTFGGFVSCRNFHFCVIVFVDSLCHS